MLVLGTGASNDDGGTYRVRAIFDSASFLVPGEDVKVAGVKVGTIESLDVTPQNKAAIVLRIDDPAFQDFKQDAFCTIRLQSLIGEKFVACQPTQPKSANSEPAPSLRKIERRGRRGPVPAAGENTSAPVDLDMLNNIMRLPERQRFAIILNELGVGLAGNGETAQRGDPARRPGALPARQTARDPRRPEPRAGRPRARLGRGARAGRAREPLDQRLHRHGGRDGAGDGRARRRPGAELREVPGLPDASCARRCAGSASSPPPARR